MSQPKRRYNNFYLGFLGGTVIAAISMAIFILSYWKYIRSFENLRFFLNQGRMFSSLLSLSALPTLFLFYYFIRTERYRSAYGMIAMMICFGIIVLILRSGEIFT